MLGRSKNMLHLRKTLSAFRACCGTTIFPTFQNVKRKRNRGFQCFPFSTTSGNQSEQPPPFKISTELPAVLQQQCKNWMNALWAEQKAKIAKKKWIDCSLKCTNISTTIRTSELEISMEKLTKEGKQVFMRYIKPSSTVLLRPFQKCPWQEDIVGILRKQLFDASGQLSASIVYVKRNFNRHEQEQIKATLFDVKPAPTVIGRQAIEWLKQNNEWPRMPGYNTMLYSFKCKQCPDSNQIGQDSTDWVGKDVKGKSAFVLSKSPAALYNLIGYYQKTTKDANYLILKRFDKQLAERIILDPNIRQNMERRSDYWKNIDSLKMSGANANKGIVFASYGGTFVNKLAIKRIIFDVLIVEEANAMNEFETWMIALPLAPIIRLFGNTDGLGSPVSSNEGRELDFEKSFLGRMEEEFGKEMNFHLQRQYRSVPAIHEWPARAFYHKRAAEPDKSVENIHLKDLLVPNAKMITDPFVLVDLNQLEGEWKKSMFEPEMGGSSFYNFGETLLVAQHLRKLFENMRQCEPSQIAYFSRYESQCLEIRQIFECFFPAQLRNLEKVRFNELDMEGQSCDVVLQSFVTADRACTLLSNPHHLKRLAFEMTRARRQCMLFARSEWLEEGSDESRQLLQTFRSHGTIIGPNDLLELKHHTQIFGTKARIINMVHRKRIAEHRKNNQEKYK